MSERADRVPGVVDRLADPSAAPGVADEGVANPGLGKRGRQAVGRPAALGDQYLTHRDRPSAAFGPREDRGRSVDGDQAGLGMDRDPRVREAFSLEGLL